MSESIFWLLVISYGAHVMEEYILNWKEWVFTVAHINVQWSEFHVTNAAVIVAGFCFAMIGFKNPYISLMFPALMIINGVFFHILPSIIQRKFSPGLLTSIFLFLPLSYSAYFEAYTAGLLNVPVLVSSASGGIIMMSYPLLLQKLKKRIASL